MRLRSGLDPASFAGESGAGIGLESRLSGRFSIESRWFPEEAAHAAQGSHASGFAAAPQLHVEDAAGRRPDRWSPSCATTRRTVAAPTPICAKPTCCSSAGVGDGEWELRVGVDRVFWGVAESQHLVDIINQVDFVEHPDGESKLGQPMVHLTWSGDWGALELFGLSGHRARTFPGPVGPAAAFPSS